jgi:hypothetical protein
MYNNNPFTPSFGREPNLMLGREKYIEDYIAGINNSFGDPRRATIFTGARGTGKTVLLKKIREQAHENSMVCVSALAIEGLLKDIIDGIYHDVSEFTSKSNAKVSGVQFAGMGIQLLRNEREYSFKYELVDLVRQISTKNIGLLIEVDEVDPTLLEMRALIAAYQYLASNDYNVALALAGLPHNVSLLLNDKALSFIRRARYVKLDSLDNASTRTLFYKTINNASRSIGEGALNKLVDNARGYPFLIQLLGFQSWEVSKDKEDISVGDVEIGIANSLSEMKRAIHDVSFRELSKKDKDYLLAMSIDKDASKVSDINKRLGVSSNYSSIYRARLIEAGVIYSPSFGYVDFQIPFMREYLRDKITT